MRWAAYARVNFELIMYGTKCRLKVPTNGLSLFGRFHWCLGLWSITNNHDVQWVLPSNYNHNCNLEVDCEDRKIVNVILGPLCWPTQKLRSTSIFSGLFLKRNLLFLKSFFFNSIGDWLMYVLIFLLWMGKSIYMFM